MDFRELRRGATFEAVSNEQAHSWLNAAYARIEDAFIGEVVAGINPAAAAYLSWVRSLPEVPEKLYPV